MTRTVVIGVDGVPFEYLDRFSDELPNVNSLRKNGIEAPLNSTFPPWTPSAWPSIYTGRHPHEHGVHGFFTYPENDPTRRRVVSRNDVDAPALWNYADAEGLTSVVVNVPVTHPAEPIDGVVLPGYLASSGADGYPTGIRNHLSANNIEYRIYATEETSPSNQAKLDSYVELVDTRAEAVDHLLSTIDWDFAFVEVQKTDAVFHNFETETTFRKVYSAMDRFVGTVLDAVNEGDDVLLVSDHGMRQVTDRKVYVNELLRKAEFITPTSGNGQRGFKEHVLNRESESTAGGFPDDAVQKFLTGISRIGVSPGSLFALAEQIGLGGPILKVLPESIREAALAYPDYDRSRAFCRLGSEMGIRVNLAGREPTGVVPPEDYETVRDEIIKCLSDVMMPNGDPVFEFVSRYESALDVEPTGDAPDVVFLPKEMSYPISHRMPGTTMLPTNSYEHTQQGIFVASGPSFAGSPEMVDATSIAPIVLGTLPVDVPTLLIDRLPDGLLVEIPELTTYDVEYGSSRADEGDGVRSHLKDLGYL